MDKISDYQYQGRSRTRVASLDMDMQCDLDQRQAMAPSRISGRSMLCDGKTEENTVTNCMA
jgi:hypothetical protein